MKGYLWFLFVAIIMAVMVLADSKPLLPPGKRDIHPGHERRNRPPGHGKRCLGLIIEKPRLAMPTSYQVG